MALYGYNYPWSGRVGRVSRCCLYCGDSGPHWQLSSHGDRCLSDKCRKLIHGGAKPIPELQAECDVESERRAREWCKKHAIDYDATVKNYLEHLGPVGETEALVATMAAWPAEEVSGMQIVKRADLRAEEREE